MLANPFLFQFLISLNIIHHTDKKIRTKTSLLKINPFNMFWSICYPKKGEGGFSWQFTYKKCGGFGVMWCTTTDEIINDTRREWTPMTRALSHSCGERLGGSRPLGRLAVSCNGVAQMLVRRSNPSLHQGNRGNLGNLTVKNSATWKRSDGLLKMVSHTIL